MVTNREWLTSEVEQNFGRQPAPICNRYATIGPMPDQTLLMLLDEIRRRTLAMLDSVNDEQARWTPAETDNSILWHGGHAYTVVEYCVMESLGRQPVIPSGWHEVFSWHSQPKKVAADAWPALSVVVDHLKEQYTRLRTLMQELSEHDLLAPATIRPQRSVRYWIVHSLHDESLHCGEMWLLRKMLASQ